MPLSHNVKQVETVADGSLIADADTDIATLAVARFMLISKLTLENIKIKKAEKILVCGCGCVGFATLLYLNIKKFKNVEYTAIHENNYLNNWIMVQDVDWHKYDVIIDTTGSNEILGNIFDNCKVQAKIVLLGTPRHKPDIDVLKIHRKNLIVFGGHELFGYSNEKRQQVFSETLTLIKQSNFDCLQVCEIVDKFTDNRDYIYQIRKNLNV